MAQAGTTKLVFSVVSWVLISWLWITIIVIDIRYMQHLNNFVSFSPLSTFIETS